MDDSDLQDIVDFSAESLGVELKGWLDLTDRLVRVNIARHLAEDRPSD